MAFRGYVERRMGIGFWLLGLTPPRSHRMGIGRWVSRGESIGWLLGCRLVSVNESALTLYF